MRPVPWVQLPPSTERLWLAEQASINFLFGRSREFVVVTDCWMSDTARAAHLVLPTNTLLEADELLASYGHHWLGAAQPVSPCPTE